MRLRRIGAQLGPQLRARREHLEVARAEEAEARPGERDAHAVVDGGEAELALDVRAHEREQHKVILLTLVSVDRGHEHLVEAARAEGGAQQQQLSNVRGEDGDARLRVPYPMEQRGQVQ